MPVIAVITAKDTRIGIPPQERACFSLDLGTLLTLAPSASMHDVIKKDRITPRAQIVIHPNIG
ncbi:MAG: hypothetical protein SPM09_09745 [Fibrobacter sp.]|nr:hypothetical protein [Fibrobacter sp.]MDY6264678.1 hypothetical protein [Fibrobacter sp.]